jgi:hypothetical protein
MLWSGGFVVLINEVEVTTRWTGHVARRHTVLVGKLKTRV